LITLVLSGNSITGPVPMSVTKLVEAEKLRDFHIFKPFPSELFESPRIFRKEEFRKLYEIGPKLGIDTIVWDNKVASTSLLSSLLLSSLLLSLLLHHYLESVWGGN